MWLLEFGCDDMTWEGRFLGRGVCLPVKVPGWRKLMLVDSWILCLDPRYGIKNFYIRRLTIFPIIY